MPHSRCKAKAAVNVNSLIPFSIFFCFCSRRVGPTREVGTFVWLSDVPPSLRGCHRGSEVEVPVRSSAAGRRAAAQSTCSPHAPPSVRAEGWGACGLGWGAGWRGGQAANHLFVIICTENRTPILYVNTKLLPEVLINVDFSRITTGRGTNFALFGMLP